MKVSEFFVNMGLPCSFSDIKIKHEMFPEIVLEVYGSQNPSGYISDAKEAEVDKLIMARYFFRYWLSMKEQSSAYSRKNYVVSNKVPYDALIEGYKIEMAPDLEKQKIFQALHSEEKKELEFYDHYGETTKYSCVVISK